MRPRLLCSISFVALALLLYFYFGMKQMSEIKFNLGQNIVETARQSGIPKFSVDKVNGSIFYSKNQIPVDIPVRYTRAGYEIIISPLFAFTLYADEKLQNNLEVTEATLQISQQAFHSHVAAQAFVQDILRQFKAGKWTRHISEFCPAVSGRSTLLDENGKLNIRGNCSPDPDYQLSDEEWLALMAVGKVYRWTGDGVIAQLSVRYSDDSRGITYSIFLEFENLSLQRQRQAKAVADRIEEGERKGWSTVAEAAADKVKTGAQIKLLEDNALKRGDKIVPR